MRSRLLKCVAVASCVVAGLGSGCGGGEESEGDTFRIGNAGAAIFDSPNPFVATSIDALAALHYMYSYLVEYDEELDIKGAFAEDWSISDGGKTWTFDLVPGAEWSDGESMSAEDVAWTINTIIEFKSGGAANLAPYVSNIERATADGPDKLVLDLVDAASESAFLGQLQNIPILPRHVWEAEATGQDGTGLKRFANEPPMVSGGPFNLVEFKERDSAVFERAESWWGPEPHIAAWGLKHYSSPDALVQALKSDEVDLALRLPPPSVETVEDSPGLTVLRETGLAFAELGFNSNPAKTDKPEIRDPRVRLAFAHAIDHQKIIDTFLLGAGTPGVSVVPPSDGRWFNENLGPVAHDPEQANQLLDELGFERGADGVREANGHRMSYELIYLDTGNNRMVELIKSDLEEVGIELVPKLVGDAAYVPAVEADNYTKFDITMDFWGALPDPDYILSTQTCGELKSFTETAYCNKRYDELYRAQGVEPDDAARQEIVWEMQEMLYEDRPYEVLFYPDSLEGVSEKWTGLVVTGNGSVTSFSNESLLNVKPAE